MPKNKKPMREFSKEGGLIGCVCVSLAGHDAASVFAIVGEDENGFVFIADGKKRLISAPKAKKTKHISIISKLSANVCESISNGTASDSLLRREIALASSGILS